MIIIIYINTQFDWPQKLNLYKRIDKEKNKKEGKKPDQKLLNHCQMLMVPQYHVLISQPGMQIKRSQLGFLKI